MIKAIIFDMDGVLINSEEFYFQRRMNFMKEQNQAPGSTNFIDYIGSSNDHIWELLVPTDLKLRQKLKNIYLDYQAKNPIFYPPYLNDNVLETLKYLKSQNLTLGLASASQKDEVEKMLDQCQLRSYFDYVLSGEEFEHNKPAPDVYLKAIEKSGYSVDQCIAVEDSTIGIQAAKTAGLQTWALKQKYPVDQERADLQFADFADFQQLYQQKKAD